MSTTTYLQHFFLIPGISSELVGRKEVYRGEKQRAIEGVTNLLDFGRLHKFLKEDCLFLG